MYTSSQLKEASEAFSTRNVLQEVNYRSNQDSPIVNSPITGAKFIPVTHSANSNPVYDQSGEIFASSLIGRADTAVALPDTISPGSIISYQNHDHQSNYAIVQKTKSPKQNKVIVKAISQNSLKSILANNPNTRIYQTSDSNLTQISLNKDKLAQLFKLLDPTETVFFKIMSNVLIGNILKLDSVWEIFTIIYLRLLLLAVIIIAIAYGIAQFL